MISVREAYEFYAREIKPLESVEIPVNESRNRYLAKDAKSRIDLPPFNQSAMDGYALVAADTKGASESNPIKLILAGEIPASRLEAVPELNSGQAVRIFTGGYVPRGADVVLPQEDALIEDGHLVMTRQLEAGRHVRDQGEEVRAGDLICSAGRVITTGVQSALSIAGIDRISVTREPKISLLTTGDEIVTAGRDLRPGEVYDANSVLVSSWLNTHGYSQVEHVAVSDTLEETVSAIRRGFETSDLVLTCGGISVGDKDFVLKAARELGVREIFWRVRQRPGKPLFFGMKNDKVLMGIPGNPGSVFVCLNVHVLQALDRLAGSAIPRPHRQTGKLAEAMELGGNREFWMRSTTQISDQGEVWIDPLPRQSSHMITNLTDCTALACIPEGDGVIEAGDVVEWISV